MNLLYNVCDHLVNSHANEITKIKSPQPRRDQRCPRLRTNQKRAQALPVSATSFFLIQGIS